MRSVAPYCGNRVQQLSTKHSFLLKTFLWNVLSVDSVLSIITKVVLLTKVFEFNLSQSKKISQLLINHQQQLSKIKHVIKKQRKYEIFSPKSYSSLVINYDYHHSTYLVKHYIKPYFLKTTLSKRFWCSLSLQLSHTKAPLS